MWAEAVNSAVYTLNRTGPSSVDGKTPYELFTGKSVHLSKLHIFGTGCFVHVPKVEWKKWDAKGQHGIFVGYSDNIDGFRIYLKSKNKIIRSRDVIFEPEKADKLLALFPSQANNKSETNDPKEFAEKNVIEPQNLSDNSSCDSSKDSSLDSEDTLLEETPKRELRDRSKLNQPKRLIEIMLAEINEPRSYNEAVKSEEYHHWKAAMEDELASLKENLTWSLVELPTGCKPILNRWVYRIKRNAEGKIDRYRARLVARGFSQREGIDYNETFSPVARFDTI